MSDVLPEVPPEGRRTTNCSTRCRWGGRWLPTRKPESAAPPADSAMSGAGVGTEPTNPGAEQRGGAPPRWSGQLGAAHRALAVGGFPRCDLHARAPGVTPWLPACAPQPAFHPGCSWGPRLRPLPGSVTHTDARHLTCPGSGRPPTPGRSENPQTGLPRSFPA